MLKRSDLFFSERSTYSLGSSNLVPDQNELDLAERLEKLFFLPPLGIFLILGLYFIVAHTALTEMDQFELLFLIGLKCHV